ncbi:MAG: hypothetical protein WAV54_01390 [Acidimicrobiales bacterium]|jgi:hypothetical protein
MYEILAATLEPHDAKIKAHYLERDREDGTSDIALDAAYGTAYRDDPFLHHLETFEFLAVKHVFETDVTIERQHYDAALLGAPVWVASPPALPLRT